MHNLRDGDWIILFFVVLILALAFLLCGVAGVDADEEDFIICLPLTEGGSKDVRPTPTVAPTSGQHQHQ